jgi:CheY-like chemotaxis protein
VSKPQKILLVENHPDVARIFSYMLGTRGHSATVVGSVREAKSRLSAEPFDLLVCDYRVDDGTAVDLMQWLREQGRKPLSICVSGYGDEAAEECIDAGYDGFISKPVDMDRFEAKVAALRAGGDGAGAGRHDGHAKA